MAERLAATTNSFAAIADELVEKIRKEGKSEVTIRKLGWFLDMAKPEPRPFSRTRGYFTPVHERGIEWDNDGITQMSLTRQQLTDCTSLERLKLA